MKETCVHTHTQTEYVFVYAHIYIYQIGELMIGKLWRVMF